MRTKWDDVAKWEAKYDQLLLATTKRNGARQRSKMVSNFLQAAGKGRLSEIDTVDVQDYLVAFGRTHTAVSVRRVKGEISSFWKWLIEIEGLDLVHVTRGGEYHGVHIHPYDARKILAAVDAEDYRLAQWLAGFFRKERREVGLSHSRLCTRWRRALRAAGAQQMTIVHFRKELRRRVWGRKLMAEYIAKQETSPLNPADYKLPWEQTHFRFADSR